jgi:hypothetical protein
MIFASWSGRAARSRWWAQSDIGDSWEWADSPDYPAHYAALGVRIGVNYVVYAMTH